MSKHIRDIIDDVLHGGFNPEFEGIVATFQFNVDGQGSWLIRIDHGTISISMGTGKADCVLSCSAEDFEPIITGRQNLLTAHMQGRLKIDGSPIMALRFINTITARAPQPPGGAQTSGERHAG
jgi:putative sterol carrier protein